MLSAAQIYHTRMESSPQNETTLAVVSALTVFKEILSNREKKQVLDELIKDKKERWVIYKFIGQQLTTTVDISDVEENGDAFITICSPITNIEANCELM